MVDKGGQEVSRGHLKFDFCGVSSLKTVVLGINMKRHAATQTPSTGLRHPSTTAVFSYVIGYRKLSANEQFFVGAQTVVSLLQTTQIKQGVSFIAINKVYISTNKTAIV